MQGVAEGEDNFYLMRRKHEMRNAHQLHSTLRTMMDISYPIKNIIFSLYLYLYLIKDGLAILVIANINHKQ